MGKNLTFPALMFLALLALVVFATMKDDPWRWFKYTDHPVIDTELEDLS